MQEYTGRIVWRAEVIPRVPVENEGDCSGAHRQGRRMRRPCPCPWRPWLKEIPGSRKSKCVWCEKALLRMGCTLRLERDQQMPLRVTT